MGTFTAPKAGLLTEVNGRISVVTGEIQLQLQAGQRIEPGSKLVISDDTKFKIQFDDGTSISNQTLNTPTSADIAAINALQAEVNEIQQQILAGDDPTEDFPETTAGQAGGQGHDGFSRVERTGNEILGSAGYDSDATNISFLGGDGEEEFLAAVIESLTLELSAPDNSTDDTPVITGTTNAAPGSVVTIVITDSEGNQQTITAEVQADGSFSADVEQPLPDGNYTADGTVIDNNNNTANDSDVGDVDTTAPAVSVAITNDQNNDGYINEAELGDSVSFVVSLGQGTAIGDTLVVTDQNGQVIFEGPVTQDMLDNGLELSTPAPENGASLEITATVTDPAGNSATGSDSAILDYGNGDGAPLAPTVVITEDSNNDGYINESELDGEVNFTITLGDGTTVGDTLVITDQQGQIIFEGPVTQDMLNNGLALSTTAPDTGTNLQITATVTDPAGNTASGSDNAILDYGNGDGAPLAPTVVITEDANNDGYINEAELNGEVNYKVTLGAGTAIGDSLIVTNQTGQVIYSGTVTQEMLDNGLELSTSAPEIGTNLVINATVTDPAGNTASSNDSGQLTSANNDFNTVGEDSPATGNVLNNDTGNTSVLTFSVNVDGDGGIQTFGAGQTANIIGIGTVTINSDGSYTFTPVDNWNDGVPEITYTTNTGDTASLSLDITAINDAPVAKDDNYELQEGGHVSGNVISDFAGRDTDVDGDSLTITHVNGQELTFIEGIAVVNMPTGTLYISANGEFDFTHSGEEPESVSFTYTVSDGELSDTATVTLNVEQVNDAPTIQVTAESFVENEAAAGDLAATYTTFDEDGDDLTVSFTDGTNTEGYYEIVNGQVVLTQTGADFVNGGGELPAVDLTVSDGSLEGQDADTPTITTTNDAPTIQVTAESFVENEAAAGDLAATYSTFDED
ncbi:MAG: retention module-containing protein, partial [Shewanella sp.]|nr:retention module-containing protein [Shewanella sp.]